MRRQLPPWAMGLAIAPLGFYYGFISTATPILLAAHGVSLGALMTLAGVGLINFLIQYGRLHMRLIKPITA